MTTVAEKKELFELGAAEMAAGIRAGTISVVALAELLLDRIRAHDLAIKAFSYLDEPAVLAEAKSLDAEARAGSFRGPLHGVPFGIKEQFDLAGAPTRLDYTDPASRVATEDATVVTRLRAAGGLLFGKLYMVGAAGTPPTRNPWNTEYTPGGSSSGSGAAVGARFLPFAMSEQTGGSGIRPAAYCGVSGLKATFGRNSRFGMANLSYSNDYPCIIGTTIADVARVFAVTSGYDPRDFSSVPVAPARASIDVAAMRPPRIGIVRNFFPALTEDYMNAAIEAAGARLAAAGAIVEDMMLPPDFGLVWKTAAIIGGAEKATLDARDNAERQRRGEDIPLIRPAATTAVAGGGARGDVTRLIPAAYYIHAQRIKRWLRDQTDAAISSFDAILMATAPGAAPHDPSTSGDASLCVPWSQLGNPAISIPGGLSPEGMPLGLQLVAPNMRDEALLATGAWCEEVLGRLPVPALA